MDSLTEYERDQTLLRAGLHEAEVAFIEPGMRRTIARRLAALEAVVEAARDALTIHEDVACSCRGCQRIRAALGALESEVAGGR